MKKHFIKKHILLLGFLVISSSLYSCSPKQADLITSSSSTNTTTPIPSGIQPDLTPAITEAVVATTIPTNTPPSTTPVTNSTPNITATITSTPITKPVDTPTVKPVITQTPTVNPVATSTPKPTVKPVATSTPKPTMKPVASSTPKPTEKPFATPSPKPTVKPTTSPKTTTVPISGEGLSVRSKTIVLGESKDNIIDKFGTPNRAVSTEYDFDYYVYNNDYTKFLMVAIKEEKVVGFYTDSLDFTFMGITYGSSLNTVNTALGEDNTLAAVITHEVLGDYTLNVLMDQIGTQKAIGIYVLSDTVQYEGYSKTVMGNVELLVLDLTNSVRARNDLNILTWSSAAGISSKKHSIDMASNDFFDHINLDGMNPGDRMKAVGISYKAFGENIVAGYGSAIFSNHGWFNSSGHRTNLLSTNFKYLGVGFTYQSDSDYKTYCTQNFYR